VYVHDDGQEVPSTDVRPPTPDAPSGRGLVIVDRLSSDWGVIASDPPPGKTVWFQLAPVPE
jgi:serine/threonine-protein kinase RsbW